MHTRRILGPRASFGPTGRPVCICGCVSVRIRKENRGRDREKRQIGDDYEAQRQRAEVLERKKRRVLLHALLLFSQSVEDKASTDSVLLQLVTCEVPARSPMRLRCCWQCWWPPTIGRSLFLYLHMAHCDMTWSGEQPKMSSKKSTAATTGPARKPMRTSKL